MFRKRRVYLDAAAGITGNPSSPHAEGRAARARLDAARAEVAALTETKTDDVIFTSGATEANALAVLGVAHAHALRTGKPARVLYLPTAHASVIENARLVESFGGKAEPLPIVDARVDVEALRQLVADDVAFISMEAVCGETGVIWNTREVKALVDARAVGGGPRAYLHVDASQAPFTEKLTRAHFGADLLVLDGAKVGPRGIGCLIAHRTVPLLPLYAGGGQERGLRPGSEAPELAEAFAAALRAAANKRDAFRDRAARDRAALIARVTARVPSVLITEGELQAPNIVNLSLPGRDTDFLVALLDEAGFAVSTRSACETDSEEGSRAVYALTGDRERARATLRISWGPDVSAGALSRFAAAFVRAVGFIDSSVRR